MSNPVVKEDRRLIAPRWQRVFPNQEWWLLLVLAIEVLVFSLTGTRFATAENGVEVVRLAIELGLLAMALTPIIVSGGIDLSVGSGMGLAAIFCGWLWREQGWPMPASVLATLGLGLVTGGVNGLLIGRLRLPPLIATLGTYSLFRGIAEGLSGGSISYNDFPAGFLFLGQGYLGGWLPPQAIVFVPAAIGYWLLLHRTTAGRALYAIGYSPEGARHAGIPVGRRLGLVYVLSGLVSSVAAVIYIAHLGQARSDAGTGYELMAITAVVLGGTSIFGGRGTILGTLLGLLSIVVLQNGMRLSGFPTELSGLLTGLLLLATILAETLTVRARRLRGTTTHPAPGAEAVPHEPELQDQEETEVKNGQVAVLSAVILAAALIVAASNWMLVRSLKGEVRGGAEPTAPSTSRRLTVAVMPKAKGDPYFISCRKGAEEAARELGIDLIWDGPTDLDPARQNEVVEGWITRQVDVIAVSVENEAAISTVLRKARARGIGVLTWDADAQPDARDYFVNQATPQGIGNTLTDEAARMMNGSGELAVITGSLSAANQNEWIRFIRARLAEKYPAMKLVAVQPSGGDRDRAFAEARNLMRVYPQLKAIVAIDAPSVPGAAEAVRQSGRRDVRVTGLSLPNLCKPYVHDGVLDSVILWDTFNLGYLTVLAARELREGRLPPGTSAIEAGRLGRIEVRDGQIILGSPFIFNRSNIDRFDF